MTSEKKKEIPILPLDVSRTVVSLCNDYDRREKELLRGEKPASVLTHYRYLNETIDAAIAEVCEEGIRETMRRDIGLNRGHRMSPIYFMADKTYKKRKRLSKLRIAEALALF